MEEGSAEDEKKTTPQVVKVELGGEEVIPGSSWSSASEDQDHGDLDPGIKDLPLSVRRVVSLVDDPTEATLTLRYFLLVTS